jgi:hypothetical protein
MKTSSFLPNSKSVFRVLVFALVVLGAAWPRAASAAKIRNPVAVFSALDKITARITTLEAPIDQPVRFGALVVTAKVCYTRPVTEKPKTTAFVIVDEHQLNGQVKRLFTGWMFAANPGLHGVEHPVYDVWLKTCKASAPRKPASGNLRKSP